LSQNYNQFNIVMCNIVTMNFIQIKKGQANEQNNVGDSIFSLFSLNFSKYNYYRSSSKYNYYSLKSAKAIYGKLNLNKKKKRCHLHYFAG